MSLHHCPQHHLQWSFSLSPAPRTHRRGVRQRHWGSWVSEIRHPILKIRIWVGTFETAEDAVRTYDEAARFMCGPRTPTNFPYHPNASSKLLAAALTAKLHRCYVASLQLHKQKTQPPEKVASTKHKPVAEAAEGNGKVKKLKLEKQSVEEEEIDQMIEELLDYGSMELSM